MTDQTVEICREAPDLLDQCGICKQEFSQPLALSQHLNVHGIEWKVYWDIYLHHVSGLTCNLCSIHHADVYTLECHIKLAHCIKTDTAPSYGAPGSADAKQGSNTIPVSSRGAADVVETVCSSNSEPSCSTVSIEAGRKMQNAELMEEVIAVRGTSAGRGRGLAGLRRGRRTVVIGRARHSELQSTMTRASYRRGIATGVRGARTVRVVTVAQNSCPAPLVVEDPEPGIDAHSETFTRGSGINTTTIPRGSGSPRNMLSRSVTKSRAEYAEDSDEVTEVGRVVAVPLDGASSIRSGGGSSAASSSSASRRFRHGGKALKRRSRTLDVIEVLDLEETPPGVTDHVSVAGSSPQLPGGRALPLLHNAAMTCTSRSQKPTAVVSPYESGREKLQHPTDDSVGNVLSSLTDEVKVVTNNGEGRSDALPRRRSTPPARTQRLITPPDPQPSAILSTGALGPHEPRVDDPADGTHSCLHQPAETLLPLLPPPGPVSQPMATPSEAQRVTEEPTAAPPLDVKRPKLISSAAAPASAPPTDGIASKPALLGWLDPVYRPGTLSRLSEQAVALSRRPGSPSQLRRLVDRSQRLKVDGQAVLAPDTGGSTAQPVRRLLAAAESDHLAAGPSRDCSPDTVPGPAAWSGPDEQRSTIKVELATTGLRPPSGRPPGASFLTIAAQADSRRNGAALTDHNKRKAVLGGDKLAGASHSERRSDENTLAARTVAATHKTELRTQVIGGGGVTKMCDDGTFFTADSAVKEESVAFHRSEGIDVHHGVELQSLHDSADVGLEVKSPMGVKVEPTAAVAEVKTEITMADSANGEPMSLDDNGGALAVDPFGLPAVACDDDPLAISDELKPTAVGSVFGGLLPRVPMVAIGERLDLSPPLTTSSAPTAAPDRRRSERPTSAGGVAATTAMAACMRRDAPVGSDGPSSARQDAGGRRRRKRLKWGEKKKKKGRRPLYSKPEGTGDGEIDPGNMVEVLFLNDDDGQEDYDAMDAMVMKVDTEVRPTRYYVHFKDTSHRHDRWVTRPEISRVYRSQLQPMQTIESSPSVAPATGDPTREEQQSAELDCAAADGLAAAETVCTQRPSSSSPVRIGSQGPPARRLAFVPDVEKWITTKPTAPLETGCLVEVVFEVTADGAQLICPAKILRVNTELSYHRYLVRYLGWQRRYCEWVTESVLLCPPSLLQRNVSGQILLRCVLSPPSCPEAAREAYSRLRPCSVDLAAGNIFFLSAARPLPRLINDARIAAMVAALRPRLADSLGSRAAHC